VLVLTIGKDVWIFVNILGDVIVTRLNEGFICGQFKRNLLVILTETHGRKNLYTTHEYGGEKIVEPSTPVRDVIGVLLRHTLVPVGNFFEKFLEHDENFTPLGHGVRFFKNFIKRLDHNWTHQMGQLSQIFPLGFYEHIQVIHL
jgi:hypothetical protein